MRAIPTRLQRSEHIPSLAENDEMTYSASLSTCLRKNSTCFTRSKSEGLCSFASGSSGDPLWAIHISYQVSSSLRRYASFPGVSLMWDNRCLTVFLGTEGNTCSKAAQSSRGRFRHLALMMAAASRARSSKSAFHWKRCLLGFLTLSSRLLN